MHATTTYSLLPTPIGELLLVGGHGALSGIYMPPHKGGPDVGEAWVRDDDAFAQARAQLDAYFAGQLTAFDLRRSVTGTVFQQLVWQELERVPYGQTISYQQLAERIGRPTAARAVGTAIGRNPLSIVVPCHRVVGATGMLTGYAGGVDRKRALLAHEMRVAAVNASNSADSRAPARTRAADTSSPAGSMTSP
jgi:methylated-DNA-[protein]-cysteine S-methyltransferase